MRKNLEEKEEIEKNKLEEDLKECTFTPKINKSKKPYIFINLYIEIKIF